MPALPDEVVLLCNDGIDVTFGPIGTEMLQVIGMVTARMHNRLAVPFPSLVVQQISNWAEQADDEVQEDLLNIIEHLPPRIDFLLPTFLVDCIELCEHLQLLALNELIHDTIQEIQIGFVDYMLERANAQPIIHNP